MLDVKNVSNLRVIKIRAYYEKTRVILQNEIYKTAVLKIRYSDGRWTTIFRKVVNNTKPKINNLIDEFISLSFEEVRQILSFVNDKTRNICNLYFGEYIKRNFNNKIECLDVCNNKSILIKIKECLLDNNFYEYYNKIEFIRIYSVNFESGIYNFCDIIEIKRIKSEMWENIFRIEYDINNRFNSILVNCKLLTYAELMDILSLIEKKEQLQIYKRYIKEFIKNKDCIKTYTKSNYLKNR